MKCKNVCKLCNKLVISNSVDFETASNSLIINIPDGSYTDGCKYCIIVAQTIPPATTIGSLVYITIGGGTERYPLVKHNCAQLTACGLRTRTKYSVCVDTNSVGGVFKLLGRPACEPDNSRKGLTGTAPTNPVVPA